MYLNDFRVDVIFEVIEEIKKANDPDLIIVVCIDKEDNKRPVDLHYDAFLHKLNVDYFDYENKPLFPNPSYEARIVPREVFVKKINPNEDYKTIFK